ncbi:MAG: hypothetical protein CM15mP84_05310 [Cellvibrionales bacterium]|nr:MAG: hypothetical protein CM15mP84_05310 [Cellvibrionales bacterium]
MAFRLNHGRNLNLISAWCTRVPNLSIPAILGGQVWLASSTPAKPSTTTLTRQLILSAGVPKQRISGRQLKLQPNDAAGRQG